MAIAETVQQEQAKTNWPVWGHSWAIRMLQNVVAPIVGDDNITQRPRHAYLFLGPRHVGKTTLARTFAKALLCVDPVVRPCGKCRSCQLIERGSHPDFRLIQPTDKDGALDRSDGTLRAEQATEIVRDVALRPLEGAYKIFLLQDMDAAHPAFANKLLKTLEEPPNRVILLVTAADRSLVLPTILSRCQQFELRPLDTSTIEQALTQQWGVELGKAQTLARLSNGRLGWAVEQVQQKSAEDDRRSAVETLMRLVAANRVERLQFAEQLAANRNNRHLFQLIELWTSWWRDILLAQSGCAEDCSNLDYRLEIASLAKAIPAEKSHAYLKTLRRIEGYLHHTVNTRLALEVLLLRLPYSA